MTIACPAPHAYEDDNKAEHDQNVREVHERSQRCTVRLDSFAERSGNHAQCRRTFAIQIASRVTIWPHNIGKRKPYECDDSADHSSGARFPTSTHVLSRNGRAVGW